MDNNMKYIKLYENFQGGKPISNKDWKKFEKVNKYLIIRCWIRKNLFDNGDGTFDYNISLNIPSSLKYKSLKEVIPLPIRTMYGAFSCFDNSELITLEGAPQYVTQEFSCGICTGLTSLKGAPQSVERYFNCWGCTGLTSLKYAPRSVGGDFYCIGCKGLISVVNDYGHEIKDWEGYSREGIRKHLNSDKFSAPNWFESLAFVGARDPEAYAQVCKDFLNETKFTDEQVEEYLNSPLIDRKSTEEDWKIANGLLDRTKKYDHSEYRDSKLDSEWKEVF